MSDSVSAEDVLRQARNLGARGWRVFPVCLGALPGQRCACGRKDVPATPHPWLKDGQLHASNINGAIGKAWSKKPTAAIGLALGVENGLWALEVQGPAGRAALETALKAMTKNSLALHTPTVQYGDHQLYLFKATREDDIPEAARRVDSPLVVRGSGSWILMPSCVDASGRKVDWSVTPNHAPLAVAPAWLSAALARAELDAEVSECATSLAAAVSSDEPKPALALPARPSPSKVTSNEPNPAVNVGDDAPYPVPADVVPHATQEAVLVPNAEREAETVPPTPTSTEKVESNEPPAVDAGAVVAEAESATSATTLAPTPELDSTPASPAKHEVQAPLTADPDDRSEEPSLTTIVAAAVVESATQAAPPPNAEPETELAPSAPTGSGQAANTVADPAVEAAADGSHPEPVPAVAMPDAVLELPIAGTVYLGKYEFVIDEEFSQLLGPQNKDEGRHLDENLHSDQQCLSPLIRWKGLNILLDGHHRLKRLLRKLMPFTVRDVELPDRDAAKLWIVNHQLGQRNLTALQAAYFHGKFYDLTKKPHGGDRRLEASGQSDPMATDEKLAKETGLSPKTIRRHAEFGHNVDTLSENCGAEVKQQILGKKAPLTQKVIAELAHLEPQEQPRAVREALQKHNTPRPSAPKSTTSNKPKKSRSAVAPAEIPSDDPVPKDLPPTKATSPTDPIMLPRIDSPDEQARILIDGLGVEKAMELSQALNRHLRPTQPSEPVQGYETPETLGPCAPIMDEERCPMSV